MAQRELSIYGHVLRHVLEKHETEPADTREQRRQAAAIKFGSRSTPTASKPN
jgi:hypothetical protein